ncbi:MAG: hypothetical protein ABSE97_08835 [Verrucomicrobiota bacterium]|jgi:hypothetical protein
MSTVSDLGLDLENLFQPAWAQEKPSANRYAKFAGEPAGRDDRQREGRRGGPRTESFGERRGPRPPRSSPKFGDRKREFFQRDDSREREHREPPPPLPEISVAFLPDENGVESLARQIKMTGRAYPLFDIARLILQKPERYSVQLMVKKKPDGAIAQPLFVCALDDTPWLTEDEAVAHVLKNHFTTFYQTERTATEPPKGTYTFVAQCGMSGVILGPPNHHDYQNQLRKLHAERFSKMPFDVFKARVRIVKDEAIVKKWVEEQSFKTEYVVLNVPEPLKLPNMEEVEKHFRAVHKETIIKSVEAHVVGGVSSRNLRSRELQQLIRHEWEQQRYFPLQLATGLSRQFAEHGLQFFKVNRTVTHVSVARPQFLDLETTPVSESIKRIIDRINTHPKCSRRQLMEALAPSLQPAVIEIKPGEQQAAVPAEPTPEQNAVIADLHWLVHQGHVLEFADGRLETAKKPLPKPPTRATPEASPRQEPEKKPAEEKPVAEGEAAMAGEPADEIAVSTEAEIPAPEQPEPAVEPASEIPAPAEPAVPSPEPVVESGATPS